MFDVKTKDGFARLHFCSEDKVGYYTVLELPTRELEEPTVQSAAMYFLRRTHRPEWLCAKRRRIRFGDLVSMGDAVYRYSEKGPAITESGLWGGFRIQPHAESGAQHV